MGLCRCTKGKVTGVNPGAKGRHLERVPSKGGWLIFSTTLHFDINKRYKHLFRKEINLSSSISVYITVSLNSILICCRLHKVRNGSVIRHLPTWHILLILFSPLLLIAEGLLWTTLKGHLIRAFIRLVAELFSRPGKKQLIIASDNRARL